jgi:sugar-specific transcriptional regulator TrmB
MRVGQEHVALLQRAGLSEYHARVLSHLLAAGKCKAPELSSLSGVPKARIYEILDDLANMGLIEVKPGRPAIYIAKRPSDTFRHLLLYKKSEAEREIAELCNMKAEFERLFCPIFRGNMKRTRKPLLKIVSVGKPSENETNLMYRKAKHEINIVSKAFEWLPRVKHDLKKAMGRGINIKILLLHPKLLNKRDADIQRAMLNLLKAELPKAEVRFSQVTLPLRGSVVDPSYDYKTGKAIFLVEERGVPLTLRDAAITENPSLVAGMKRYFDLIWKYESSPTAAKAR